MEYYVGLDDRDVLALDEAILVQAAAERLDEVRGFLTARS